MRKIFTQAKSIAEQGHYLQRRIGLAKLFGIPEHYIALAEAFQEFMRGNSKPAGLDEFLLDMDSMILHCIKKRTPTPDEWQCIVWGVDQEALERYGIQRNGGSHSARSNMG